MASVQGKGSPCAELAQVLRPARHGSGLNSDQRPPFVELLDFRQRRWPALRAAMDLARPFDVTGPVESPPCILQRPFLGLPCS